MQIEITGLRLFGAHGLYQEETLVENEFELNLIIAYTPPAVITAIEETPDYSKAIEIIKEQFQNPSELLEPLAMKIAEKLRENFPLILRQEINIVKLHAPISAFRGKVGIRYIKEY